MSAQVSWRCRRGRHAWRFVSMSDHRTISVYHHTANLCRLVERCDRCRLTRTTPAAEVPKRPRMPRTTTTPTTPPQHDESTEDQA